jgi:hypothetical protein
VNWIVARAVKVGLVLTIALLVGIYLSAGIERIFLDVYLLAMGGVLLLALVRTTWARGSGDRQSQFDRTLREMRRPREDSGPLALARELDLSTISAFHLHVRLRPMLREIAAHRVRRRYGVELDDEPARARELVGTEAWEIVRPNRPLPADRLAVGPPLSTLRTVVDELERI